MLQTSASRLLPIAAVALSLVACGSWLRATVEHHDDGTFTITCRDSLPRCLERAEETCHGSRYEVLNAVDTHDYYGPGDVTLQTETRTSTALVRCGPHGRPLFTNAAPKPAPPPPPRACVPGSTQPCVGPGACRGGQACVADGSGFGTCVCAPPLAPDAGSVQPP